MAFVFQACYGPPARYHEDYSITGKVVDADNSAVPGVGLVISISGHERYVTTTDDGSFGIYADVLDNLTFSLATGQDTPAVPFNRVDTVASAYRELEVVLHKD